MTEIDWKAEARKWEARARAHDREADELAAEVEEWKARARQHKNKAHTWRMLYQDLLEKVAAKLDIEHDHRTVNTDRRNDR